MISLKEIKNIYFIGIGGIGMSALARYFRFQGKQVSGYDKSETALSRQLVAEGIPVHYEENLNLVPMDAQLVVYTPAVPVAHRELKYYREHNYPVVKRSELLGLITESAFNICIAGTHGKTTISTMVACLLRETGYGCNAFLGGIAVNYNTNYWSNEKNVCVVEADEYDRSFLKLSPDIAVISAMDADHLDIYGNQATMEEAFIEFSDKLKPGGILFSKYGLKRSADLKAPAQFTYSLDNPNADAYAINIKIENGGYFFDVVTKSETIKELRLNMGGVHNVENAVVAVSIASQMGIAPAKIRSALAAFRGVKRRFEYIIKKEDRVFIDDYAHHPEELKALIGSAKALFSNKRCRIIFQPHLFSRTRDLAKEFAASLDLADEITLLPIYPARELPIEGVTNQLIFDQMKNTKKKMMSRESVLEELNAEWTREHPATAAMVITAGAGDIDQMIEPIERILNKV